MAGEHPTAGPLNLWLGRLVERQELRAKLRAGEFFGEWRKIEGKAR
jgi:hypothetical protein